MKKYSRMRSLFIALLSMSASYSFAQTTLTGKVTDAANKPIKDAGVYLKGDDGKSVSLSDSLGQFSSQPLAAGKYKVKIVINNKVLKADDIEVPAGSNKGGYYAFTVSDKKVTTTITSPNSSMTSGNGMGNYKTRVVEPNGTMKEEASSGLQTANSRRELSTKNRK